MTKHNEKPVIATEADEHVVLEGLRQELVNLSDTQATIQARAAAENRLMSPEEQGAFDGHQSHFEEIASEVDRREKAISNRERLATVQPRKTQSATPAPASGAPTATGRIEGGDYSGATRGTWGWRSMSEMMVSAHASMAKGAPTDARFIRAAATTYGNEGTNADGGFVVPPDFREAIYKPILGEQSLLPMTDMLTTARNSVTIPTDMTTPWQTSGGVLVAIEGEAAVAAQTKPAVGQLALPLFKLQALVPMTDELMEDAPVMNSYLPAKIGEKFTSKINDLIVAGTGTGQPTGLLNSASLVTYTTGSAGTVITYNAIKGMWSRLYGPLRFGAVWVINQDVEPQLLGMTAPGGSQPAYLPPGGASASPYYTLLGRPVIPVQAAKSVGTVGDIILWNPKAYVTAVKAGGMKSDVSIHFFFDQGATAFRFNMRMGGKSWWSAAVNPQNGSATLTNIVALNATNRA